MASTITAMPQASGRRQPKPTTSIFHGRCPSVRAGHQASPLVDASHTPVMVGRSVRFTTASRSAVSPSSSIWSRSRDENRSTTCWAVVAGAVEAAVHPPLDPPSHRGEECRGRQGGARNRQRVVPTDDGAERSYPPRSTRGDDHGHDGVGQVRLMSRSISYRPRRVTARNSVLPTRMTKPMLIKEDSSGGRSPGMVTAKKTTATTPTHASHLIC